MSLHLNVLHNTVAGNPSSASRIFSPYRHEFRWNDDFTAYYPIVLKWWDDASYLAYQSGDSYTKG